MKKRYASIPSGKPFAWGAAESAAIETILGRYPTKRAALLPVLWIVQERDGWICREAVEAVAELLSLSPAEIDGVLTFYTMYNIEPVGKHHLQFCTSISCHLNGADELVDHCSRKLGVALGETTADGRFTLSEVECIGGCDRAPSMQVNDKFHEPMDRASLDRLLEELSGR